MEIQMTYMGNKEGRAPCGKVSYKKAIVELGVLLVVDRFGQLTCDKDI